MAIVEICDICRREASKENGVTLKCSDMEGMKFDDIYPVREKRKYKIRILANCCLTKGGRRRMYQDNP